MAPSAERLSKIIAHGIFVFKKQCTSFCSHCFASDGPKPACATQRFQSSPSVTDTCRVKHKRYICLFENNFFDDVGFICKCMQYCSSRIVVLFNIEGLMLERRNSSALAVELRLSCTSPLILYLCQQSVVLGSNTVNEPLFVSNGSIMLKYICFPLPK